MDKKFDGTNKSLLDKSRRPHSHSNQHSEEKLRNINDEKFIYVYPFLKKRGTKIGWYR